MGGKKSYLRAPTALNKKKSFGVIYAELSRLGLFLYLQYGNSALPKINNINLDLVKNRKPLDIVRGISASS